MLGKKSTKKSVSEWTVNEEAQQHFTDPTQYRTNSLDIIKKSSIEVRELIRQAKENYQQGNFVDSAKLFRQLGRVVRDIEFDCEVKGDFDERNHLNDLTGKEWLRHSKSWLVVDGKPSDIDADIENHPASYPPDMCKFFIEFFSKKDEWVFDPFMGIGSTLAACVDLKRNCWGTELNPKYAEYAQRRSLKNQTDLDAFLTTDKKPKNTYQVINADARDTYTIWQELGYPPVKFVITSPPYWNMLGESRGGVNSSQKQHMEEGHDEKYSDDPRDIGNIEDSAQYLEDMRQIFLEIKKIMVPGGYLMIILQNVRPKDGIMRPIAWQFALMLSQDFLLRQEFIWCQDQKFMGIWGYPTVYVSNVHHHYCIVVQNPNKESPEVPDSDS